MANATDNTLSFVTLLKNGLECCCQRRDNNKKTTLEVYVRTTTRSSLIFPAWALICAGAVAFLYCASAGLLTA
ncbi:hypothetical protein DIT72_00395 [Marinobacter orientalis]|nr:hypothetical protein DIT72_00395 [Marinobacter orientalis]